MADFEEKLFLNACRAPTRSLTLCDRGLRYVPGVVGRLTELRQLNIKKNRIKTLAKELAGLQHFSVLNVGHNELEELPECFCGCTSLEKLHLFSNKLTALAPNVLGSMVSLTFLNLNNNQIADLPAEIGNMVNLKQLSIDGNSLVQLPKQIGNLQKLQELHIADNKLRSLPSAIGHLHDLRQLYAMKNSLTALPRAIGKCTKLSTIDTTANYISFYPAEMLHLPLKQFHVFANPLIQCWPFPVEQEAEVLCLRELSARAVLAAAADPKSRVRFHLQRNSSMKALLAPARHCAHCNSYFLNSYLECVRFVDIKKAFHTSNNPGLVPIQALLCSHACFSKQKEETFFGVLALSQP